MYVLHMKIMIFREIVINIHLNKWTKMRVKTHRKVCHIVENYDEGTYN